MEKIKIENMISSNGNKFANQFTVTTPRGVYFQSYETLIAFKPSKGNAIYLDADRWDYSVTTGKYRNALLGEAKKETEKKIENGVYVLTNLNEGANDEYRNA